MFIKVTYLTTSKAILTTEIKLTWCEQKKMKESGTVGIAMR